MPRIPLKNQIIEWLKTQPYWLQYSGNVLLESASLSDENIQETYNYFKEDCNLKEIFEERPEISFIEVSISDDETTRNLKLISINNIENVNALASGQRIEINENLTIIYGNNGSGKSGYIRLLNNAFKTRGDKKIIGNVFKIDVDGQPNCNFLFQTVGEPYEKVYQTERESFEFDKFTAFDTQSIKVHLDNDNQLNFTPSGFEFFEKIEELFSVIREKLNAEIASNRPINNFILHFKNENVIKNQIVNLGAATNIEDISNLGAFSEADAKQLEIVTKNIAELRELNIQSKIESLELINRELDSFILNQQKTLNYLTSEKIQYYNNLIISFHQFQQLSNEDGIKSLEDYNINLVGSLEWRNFILAAKNYLDVFEQSKKANTNDDGDDNHCLFCLQPLSDRENTLIQKYWQFLKSEAENEKNKIAQQINIEVTQLESVIPILFNETVNLYSYLHNTNPELTEKWKTIVENSENSKLNLIQKLKSLNQELPITAFGANINDFNDIVGSIRTEIEELFKKKPDQEIATLTFQLNYLTDKDLLKRFLPDILDFIKKHKWALEAETKLNNLKTNSVTTFQGALFSQHITEKYKEKFNEECEKLNAPKVVEIIQQNSKMKSSRKLQIANFSASQILSEGEQRAISLADFLTEVQLNPNNSGVIFDDPVTSLDHQRKGIIAKRLVELSQSKQVIIFTHDLLFVNYLKNITLQLNVPFQCHWIEKISEFSGVISNNNSPATEGDYKTLKFANDAWELSRKAVPEEREKILKDGFAALRTNYEYLIIFDLFKEVVLRFEERVSVERLKEVVVLPDFTAKLITKVGTLSRYIEAHLHSDLYVATKPTSDELKREMEDFTALKKELSELRKSVLNN